MAAPQHLQRPPVAALKLPPRPMTTPRSVSFSHSVFSPLPSTPSFLSPSPTPRPRPSESPAWLLLLLFHILPLYVARSWLTSHLSSSNSSTTIIFTFLVLLSSSITFALLQEKQARTLATLSITASQWGLLIFNAILICASVFFKLEAVRTCGPLVAIMAEYSGALLGKLLLPEKSSSSSTGSIRGLLVTILGMVLLSQGWTIESCSPLAIKHRLKMFSSGTETEEGFKLGICDNFPVWPAIASGLLSSFVKLVSTRTSLRMIPKKRVQGLSSVCATLLMLPLAVFQLDSLFLAHASALWPLTCMLVLGLARSIMGDFYLEDRLQIPTGSSRHLFITLACSCLLELVFGTDISPLGFLLCSALLLVGVRELQGRNSTFSWDSIVEQEASDSFIKGPLRHIAADRKSRKIAFFLAMNAAFMVVEFVSGFMSNSLGLVSDACHMLFDCAALAIGLYASYISKLQPNSVFSYGYGRFEVLSGFANAVFLVLVASLIVLESIERILDPPEISTEKLLMVSVGGLLVNVVGLIFFHEEHHHAHHGHHQHGEHRHEEDDHHHCSSHGHQPEVKTCNGVHHLDHLMHHHDHGSHSHGDHSEDHQHHSCDHHHHHHQEKLHEHEQGHHHHQNHERDLHNHQNHEHDHHHHQHHEQDHGHLHRENHGHDHHHHQEKLHNHEHDHHDRHQVHKQDHEHDHHHIDHNMRGIFLHVLADTLGSVGVVISTILIQYKGWMFTDPACSIFISAMIIASVIPLLKNSAELLLQRTPRALEKKLHVALEKVRHVEGVAGFERLHVWSFTNSEIVGTLHLHALNSANKDEVRERVYRLLSKLGITDLTIQVEEI